ncbi:MAG: serine/threonine-protein kinase [Planctomycetaceae bacterium]
MPAAPSKLRVRQRLGKYKIEKVLGEGGFATVYQAMDTIMGTRIALKIPHATLVDEDLLRSFRKEARLLASVEHSGILPIKDASIVDGRLVISFPLGIETLHERLSRRMSFETIMSVMDQLLAAVAFAHQKHIIHCDIKPENVIMFEGGQPRLADFGIAKVARETVRGCGTGTVGYMAPEQAMGRPSARSDVFSLGLLFYRLMSGRWPEWPFEWPLPGAQKLKSRLDPKMISWLKKSIEIRPGQRFADAVQMRNAFLKLRSGAFRFVEKQRARRRTGPTTTTRPRARTHRAA